MSATTILLTLALLPTVDGEHGDALVLTDGRIVAGLDLERGEHGYTANFEHGKIFVPDRLIESAFLEGGTDYVPRTEEEREMYEREGLVPYDGQWVTLAKRQRLVEDRLEEEREALEELRSHNQWRSRYQEESKHFTWNFTVPYHVFEEYRDKMEAYYEAFADDWRVKQTKKLNICFYGSRSEFMRTGGVGPYILGYFMFVGDYDLNIFYDRNDPKGCEDTMFHEANHYLQKLVNEEFKIPHFPGESIAEYYGASVYDPEKKKFTTGLVQPGRLTEVKGDIARGEWVGLEELILTDGMYQHYTWGWSLVHFLMHDKRYKKKFKDFFEELCTGRKVKRHFLMQNLYGVETEEVMRVFREELDLDDDADLAKLEAEWHAYVDELEVDSVRGKELAALDARRTGRGIRAKRLFEEAIEEGTERPYVFYAYADVLYDEGDKERALEYWKMALELDPLNASFYYLMGRTIREDDEVEGERLMALAKELDPDVDRLN